MHQDSAAQTAVIADGPVAEAIELLDAMAVPPAEMALARLKGAFAAAGRSPDPATCAVVLMKASHGFASNCGASMEATYVS